MKKKLLSITILCIIFTLVSSTSIFASSWYAGAIKSGSQKGIAAQIKTPSSLPTLGGSGESCWVTNIYNGNWVQTGMRYYSGYSGFKTYVEHNISGVYEMQEIGTHLLDFTVHYKVSYESSDSKWHAYIAGYDKGSWSMNSTATVEAMGESHATDTQLGPFNFIQVVYKDSSNNWNWNDSTPYADSPYNVDITDNANYRVY